MDANVSSRPRRSCLAVPGSSARFINKARTLPVDMVFLDLEDAVAPDAKAGARSTVVAALTEGGWGDRLRVVRVNDLTTAWAYRDVVDVVEGAGAHLDAVMLPKVRDAFQVRWLDLTLSQIELATGLPPGGIGIELQIESAAGLLAIEEIAAASPRTQTLVLGPADLNASLRTRTMTVGEQPPGYDTGDAYHYARMRMLVTARAYGLQAIDGPYPRIDDLEGFRRAAGRTAALGYDGVWVLHPSQVNIANEVFSPGQEEFDRAEELLDVYAFATSSAGGHRGAVMHDGQMIDEASRAMALVVSARTGGRTHEEYGRPSVRRMRGQDGSWP